jgi:type 1 fimbriae regulatory protein FimB/type 1 fimbriae regulatory protein FimE
VARLSCGAARGDESSYTDKQKRQATGLQGAPPHAAARLWIALANKGHDTRALQAYQGHKNIQHTVRYTELSPERFKDFWR